MNDMNCCHYAAVIIEMRNVVRPVFAAILSIMIWIIEFRQYYYYFSWDAVDCATSYSIEAKTKIIPFVIQPVENCNFCLNDA